MSSFKIIGSPITCDGIGEEDVVFIEDGMWVGEVDWNDVQRRKPKYTLLGVDPSSVVSYFLKQEEINELPELWVCNIIAERPFGVLREESDLFNENGSRLFDVAGQLRNGRIVSLNVKHPRIVMGAGKRRWMRLGILTDFVKMDIIDFWNFYFPFRRYEDIVEDRNKLRLTVAVDNCQDSRCVRLASANIMTSVSLNRLWVPANWAMDILRLHALGLCPTKVC